MFISDTWTDEEETEHGILNEGGEIVVVCHECGHAIGISPANEYPYGYDPDPYSAMSWWSTQNAKDMGGYWYYSKEYWSMANLDYYLSE